MLVFFPSKTLRFVAFICLVGTAVEAQDSESQSLFRRASSAVFSKFSALRGVSATPPENTPQLGRIYSRIAQTDHELRNPIIVIPGILGSRLVDVKSNEVAWGTVNISDSRLFRRRASTLAALPMQQTTPLNQLRDNIVATETLRELELKLPWYPIQIQAYGDILNSLGVGGYRSETASNAGIVDYGDDHFTCFEFHYDWRRDCAETAKELGEFMRSRAAYVRRIRREKYGVESDIVKFDIVAHSMGGLIARYFLRYGDQQLPEDGKLPTLNWAGADLVDTLVTVGTPNAGSAFAVEELIAGLRYSKAFPAYDPAVVGTMPAVYQLLPRPRHRPVIDTQARANVNLYDWRIWQKFGWGLLDPAQDVVLKDLLPRAKDRQTRVAIATDHLRKCLLKAWQFHQALDLPAKPPEGTELFLIAADSEMTPAQAAVSPQSPKPEFIQQAPGDGTVSRASALMDERLGIPARDWTPRLQSPIQWTGIHFIFTNHIGLTSSPAFTDNVLHLLLERPRPIR